MINKKANGMNFNRSNLSLLLIVYLKGKDNAENKKEILNKNTE